jgi:microcompartment protein CcmK/EutM
MQLAKVIGNLVSTHKSEKLKGKKLLFVQPVDENLVPFGDEVLAVDAVGAGIGDIVVTISEGGSSRLVTKAEGPYSPIEVCIAGIVDSVLIKDNYKIIE